MQADSALGNHSKAQIGAWVAMIAFVIASTIPLPVFAKEGKRVAFVVGINTYDNFGKDKYLERAASDARAVSQTLKTMGYEVIEGIDVTLSDFDKKWQAALEKTTSEDTLLFFFSGHGVEIDGENFLLPRDVPFFAFGRDRQFKRRAVSVTELLAELRTGDRKSPKVTVMILDACRDNPTIPPQYKAKGMMPQGGLAKVPKTRGTFILYAAEPGKLSLDRLGPDDTDPNSVFTRSLLPLLGQANLSIQSLAIQVKEKVHAVTESYEQLPEYTDGLIGQFCLAGCAIKGEKNPGRLKENVAGTIPSNLPNSVFGIDGAPMVLVAAGKFVMGSQDDDESAQSDERPAHPVYLDDFYIDQYEVTTARYATFLQETKRAAPVIWSVEVFKTHGKKPVVGIHWQDARDYCVWVGRRLPTEAEWEKAARGADQRLYPWGSNPPNDQLANFGGTSAFEYHKLADVGVLVEGKSPYQAYDMAGNVWEWTADWYDENYYRTSPTNNPKGPSHGKYRVVRGGSWFYPADSLRVANRNWEPLLTRNGNVGFRCAQDAK